MDLIQNQYQVVMMGVSIKKSWGLLAGTVSGVCDSDLGVVGSSPTMGVEITYNL